MSQKHTQPDASQCGEEPRPPPGNGPGPQGSFTDGMGGVGGPKAEPLPGEVCKASNTVVGDLVHLISPGFLLLLHMLE